MSDPVTTYRLQLNQSFGFEQVRTLIPYFAELGVTHLYLSPIWTARPGSLHGYDCCDPAVVNPELGGEEGFTVLSQEARAAGIGLILDFVPNHLCADSLNNLAWRETLRNGPSSPYSEYFDIDWRPVKPELHDKVLLPILGRQYGEVLESGELRLLYRDGEFHLMYWDRDLPLNPRQNHLVLRHGLAELTEQLKDQEEALLEYKSIIFQLEHLPRYVEAAEEAREDRLREALVARQRLAKLVDSNAAVRAHLDRTLLYFNGEPGVAASFDALHQLLELQVYRLSYWRTAMHEINYRRFFDINELAGLRMENAAVYEASHAKAFELLRRGLADGLRLDHVDGLYDPPAYFQQLRQSLAEAAPGAYVVVEKILSGPEPLNEAWPVDGTTGYEFLNQVNRLFVQPAQLASLRRFYRRFTRNSARFDHIVYTSKQQIIMTSMASELNVLAHELNRLSEQDRRSRDFTLDSLQEGLREIAACFPVYRTYISDRGVSEADRQAIHQAVSAARARNPAMEASVLSFIESHLAPVRADGEPARQWNRRLRFAMKFQQYTAPVQAKGVEDTVFYRYAPLVSLNEVGGHPSHIGSPAADFHAANASRRSTHPRSMLATATHDTKRGEDARARLNVLSEIPEEWSKKVREWSRINASARTALASSFAPDRNDEYLFYQNLLSVWPYGEAEASEELTGRLRAYMGKAVKEAKVHASWINPSNEYEAAVDGFVERTLRGKESGRFLASFSPFANRVAKYGEWNSIAQLVLKIASPGVADFYQGVEFWDLSLVDPDNRRPVDFAARREWLERWRRHVEHCRAEKQPYWVAGGWPLKAGITALGLEFRRRYADLILRGEYTPLEASGAGADHVVAFLRTHDGRCAIAAVARWLAGSGADTVEGAVTAWPQMMLPVPAEFQSRRWVDVLSNRVFEPGPELGIPDLFSEAPAVILLSD
jgi:(1->4)-alpha-D-glucan 1-alpha-D-glucosylmutase